MQNKGFCTFDQGDLIKIQRQIQAFHVSITITTLYVQEVLFILIKRVAF